MNNLGGHWKIKRLSGKRVFATRNNPLFWFNFLGKTGFASFNVPKLTTKNFS